MNTMIGGLVGVCFSTVFTAGMCLLCYFGFGNPNYLPSEGETYLGWVMMLFGSTAGAFVLLGLIFDTLGLIQYFFRRNR